MDTLARSETPAAPPPDVPARIQRPLRIMFEYAEAALDRVFGPAWNPLYFLGPLGFYYYWIVAVSGIYVYIFFDTGTTEAYQSVEYMTYQQWYLGGVMRSLHRYASDGMVLMMVVHIAREFAMGRYRGPRWFTWITGVPIFWLVIASGITGYWLVWDTLAQYIAIATTEWFDWLGIFGEPIARNFLTPEDLDDRFFTLLLFMHIAVPLILLFVLWIHLQRISRPRFNPNRGLAVGTFVMLLALAFVHPAESQEPANLSVVPGTLDIDWYYLAIYPFMDATSYGAGWGFAVAASLMLFVLPWVPPLKQPAAAAVDLSNCNGCTRCAEDCPYNAITMMPRSDGLPFDHEAQVDPDLCVRCGICAGACPTATPFRRASDLIPGIDLPQRPLRALRDDLARRTAKLDGPARIVVFGCDHGVRVADIEGPGIAAFSLPCIAALPPSFIDYVLSRDLADGVVLTGCREGECYNRFGVMWTKMRLAGERDPYLRKRVPRERLLTYWGGTLDRRGLSNAVAAFAARIAALPRFDPLRPGASARANARPDAAAPSETVD